jgi:UDP-glucuronate decarboxylase
MSNVLKCALKYDAKVLQASTSEVYGNPDENHHPQKEDYFGNVNPNGIRSCYDEGKRIAEELCIDYNMQYGLRTYIVRIFNTYGPYMRIDDGRVVTNFISQALSNKNLTIYGTGMQTRSMQYIDDLIDGILLLVDSDYHYPVNIGNPTEYSVNEIADIILAEANGASKKVFKDLPKDDPERRKPDITLARKILNWEPKVDFKNGLSKTTNYFKNDSNT